MNTTTLNMTTLDGGVIIKKGTAPAPPSGGESGGSTTDYEYFALSDGWESDLGDFFPAYSSLVKAPTSALGMVIATPQLASAFNGGSVVPVALAVDMSLMINAGGQQMTIKDSILGNGATEESLAKYRITKAEFYNLE